MKKPNNIDVLPNTLLFYICITDLLGNIIYFLSPFVYANTNLCYIQGLGVNFDSMSKLFWVSCIALNYFIGFKKMRFNYFENYRPTFVFICYGVPLIFMIALCITHVLNNEKVIDVTGAWCWIKSSYIFYRLIFFYIWLILMLFICIVLFIRVIFTLRHYNIVSFLIYKFAAYMSVYAVISIISITNRLYEMQNEPNQVLMSIQALTAPAQGIWFCLVFIYFARKDVPPILEETENITMKV